MCSLRSILIAIVGLTASAPWLAAEELRHHEVQTGERPEDCEGDGEPLPKKLYLDHKPKFRGDCLIGMAFSPDGRILVTGGEEIRLWDPKSRKLIRSFRGFNSRDNGDYNRLAFSPDGRFLFSDGGSSAYNRDKDGGPLHDIYLWEVSTGKLIRKFRGNHNSIYSLAVAPDGKTLVSCCYAGSIRAWDVASGRELSRPYCRPGGQNGSEGTVAFSPDGNFLGIPIPPSSSSPCLLSLWDLAHDHKVRKLLPKEKDRGIMRPLAFAPDGRNLAAAICCGKKAISVWDVESGRIISELVSAKQVPVTLPSRSKEPPPPEILAKLARSKFREWSHYFVSGLAYSPDSKLLASLGKFQSGRAPSDGREELRLWETATGRELARWKVRPGCGGELAFSPDGRILALEMGEPRNHSVHLLEWGRRYAGEAKPASGVERTNVATRWADLAGSDARTAFRAVRELIARPGPAVELLGKHVQPIPAVSPARLAQWIAELDDTDFGVRERASAELARLVEGAEPALREAVASPSLEVRRRARQLLERLTTPPSQERVRFLRAVMVLEYIGTAEARRVLKKLSEGMRGARETDDARAACLRLERRGKIHIGYP